jgi:hypothetical protein
MSYNNKNEVLQGTFSRIVGTTFGEKDSNGIPLKQRYLAKLKEKDIKSLRLVREPDNPYDPNAISIHADFGSGDVALGFVKNSDRVCIGCASEFKKADSDECPKCKGVLLREGLASTICRSMELGFTYGAYITEITGGDNGKNYGANIYINRIES